MTALREAAQQALAFTMRDFASLRDFEAAKAVLHDNLRAALEENGRDWSLLEATQESLREHMTEIQRLRAALAQPAPEPETCTWHQNGDSDSGLYGTSCRHYFNLEDGTPEDNRMQWCCYCGKKLAQELIAENSDD